MNQPLAGFAPAPVTARMENHGNHMLKVAMQSGSDLFARVGSMVAYEGFIQYEPNPPAVRQIARDASAQDYRWSSLISAIVRSTPFTMGIVQGEPSEGSVRSAPVQKEIVQR